MIDKLLDEVYWNELEEIVDGYLTAKNLPKDILWASGSSYSKEKYLEFAAGNFFDSMMFNYNRPEHVNLNLTPGDHLHYSFNEITTELRNHLPYLRGILIKKIVKSDLIIEQDGNIIVPAYLKMKDGLEKYEKTSQLVLEHKKEMNIDSLFLKFK